jgi:peptidyl-prolyl cis-trans isomerase SurA
MKKRYSATVAALFVIMLTGGCASNDSAVTKDSAATTINRDQAVDDFKKNRNITNAIVAIVNDEIITLYDVGREALPLINDAEKKGILNNTVRSQIRQTALDRLIEKKLTEQKIKELNIRVTEEEIRQAIDDVRKQNNIPTQEALVAALAGQGLSFDLYRAQLREQIEKLKLVSMEVRAKVQVGEGEMLDYYKANLTRYTEEESFRARHIFFKIDEKMSSEDIKTLKSTAQLVLAGAKAGKDFAKLAKKFSEDPAAQKDGGDMGSFKKGDMQPELEKTILSLKPGEISELVTTSMGLHIIKLEARTAGSPRPFENVKAEIEEIIYKKKSEERFSQWAKDLRTKASVEIRELEGLL